MQHHRFRPKPGYTPLSTAVAPAPAAGTFLVCPVVLLQGWMGQPCPWRTIYQLAYEQAQAVLRPSSLERFQAVSWN